MHVPFCARRCGYCNFTVVAGRDNLQDDYLRALEIELSWLGEPREVDTLFLGGGTPTQLRGSRLEKLLATVRHWFVPAAGCELSVEANPLDLDEESAAILAEHGVTRLSLGGQSFHEAKLRLLERDHAPDDVLRAIHLARRRFESVSLDLIFGVPGETLADWQADLTRVIGCGVDHVSTYGLTFERGTTFWGRLARGQLQRLDEETERAMYLAAIDRLTAGNLRQYEVSNFARPGHPCRHNETYWTGRGYFAAGPGAARYVAGRREMNHRSTTTWLRRVLAGQSPVAETETLGPEDRAREALVFGLRRIEGVERGDFAARFGFEVDALAGPALRRHINAGLLVQRGTRLRLTRSGLCVSDSIWPDLLRC